MNNNTAPTVPNAQLSHIGIAVQDMDRMIGFYQRFLGMKLVDRGTMAGRDLAFLSRTPEEHHQLVMIQDPSRAPRESTLGQLSFRLDDLEALCTFYALLEEAGVTGLEGRNHGNSWSLYCFDPEGNKIELYVPTDWHFPQPWRAPLDLHQSAAYIRAETEALFREVPNTVSMAEWKRNF